MTTLETAVIVSAVIDAFAILLWGFAFYKAMTLWKDKNKRLLLGAAILMGMFSAGTDYGFVYLFFDERPFLQRIPEYINATIVQAIFYGLYHTLFLYIKILRLNLTKRIANKNISNALMALNILYYVAGIGFCLSYIFFYSGLISNDTIRYSMTSFAIVEIFSGTVVELATVAYLYHVFCYKENGLKSRFGIIHCLALLVGLFAVICVILGPIHFNNPLPDITIVFRTLYVPTFLWFQSITCFALISSVSTARDQVQQRSVAISNSVQKNQASRATEKSLQIDN